MPSVVSKSTAGLRREADEKVNKRMVCNIHPACDPQSADQLHDFAVNSATSQTGRYYKMLMYDAICD